MLGRWQTNCYVIGDRRTSTAVIVDPGEHGERFVPPLVDALEVSVEAILLTHGHLDHLWAVPSLARKFDVPVMLHAADRWLWDDPGATFGASAEILAAEFVGGWDPPTERLVTVDDHQRLGLAGHAFRVRHNPGHTPGHVTYLAADMRGVDLQLDLATVADVGGSAEACAEAEVLFSGDLVFAGSIGRTDFPRGSMDDMMQSLVDSVLALEDDTLILSGHGPRTTVGRERATNPFLHQAQMVARSRGQQV
ncbi:MAG: MBL fold metallo-hydrolase [Nitriliruptoraceae bacterium]